MDRWISYGRFSLVLTDLVLESDVEEHWVGRLLDVGSETSLSLI